MTRCASYLTIADWIALTTAVATVVGVFVVWLQTGKLARQLTLQQFSDYTKRYQEIVLNFPENVNAPSFVLPPSSSEDYARTMRYMRAYMDLCYEEWYLHKRGFIDKAIWDVWHGGIETALSKPAFQQAWQVIRVTSRFGTEFEAFVAQCIENSSNSA